MLLFTNLVAFGHGCNPDIGRKTCDVEKTCEGRGSVRARHQQAFLHGALHPNPRNHCVRLLDVIELPNEPPIMVHPLLRPFDSPPIQTFGEFVTFFAQICEVGLSYS